jgi:hypothetical protein
VGELKKDCGADGRFVVTAAAPDKEVHPSERWRRPTGGHRDDADSPRVSETRERIGRDAGADGPIRAERNVKLAASPPTKSTPCSLSIVSSLNMSNPQSPRSLQRPAFDEIGVRAPPRRKKSHRARAVPSPPPRLRSETFPASTIMALGDTTHLLSVAPPPSRLQSPSPTPPTRPLLRRPSPLPLLQPRVLHIRIGEEGTACLEGGCRLWRK